MTDAQEEADILSCSICLDLMKEPKVLPCLHRLCEDCLSDHITASTAMNSAKPTGFSCPECRQFTVPVNIGSPPSTWAAQFKTDFLIKGLTELYASRQELHKNNKQYINHPCLEHRNMEVDLYCVDCSIAVCHLCAATTHANCDWLVTVKKAAQDQRSILHEKIHGIQPLIDGALDREQVRELSMRVVNNKVMLADKEIRQFAGKVHKFVNEQKEHLLNELHKNYEDLQQNISLDVFKLTDDVNKLQDHVKMGKLKLANTSDLDLFLDASFNAAIDSCSKQTVSLNQHYGSLFKKISHVECRFDASKTPCVSLGNILFVSNFKGSDNPKLSDSQSSKFILRAMSSQASDVNFGSMPSSSGLPGSQFSQGSMPSSSGLPGSQFSQGSMPSSSGLPGSQFSQGSMPSSSGLPGSQFSQGSMPRPKSLHVSKFSKGSMPRPKCLHALKISQGSMPRTISLHASKISQGSMPRPKSVHASKISQGPMPRPKSLHASKISQGSMPRPKSLHASKISQGSMPRPKSLHASKFSNGSMPRPKCLHASKFFQGSMPRSSSRHASKVSKGSMPRPPSLHASSLHASSLHASSLHASSLHASSLHASSLHETGLHASNNFQGSMPPPLGFQSSNLKLRPSPSTSGRQASMINGGSMLGNQIRSVISRVRPLIETCAESIDDEIERKRKKS